MGGGKLGGRSRMVEGRGARREGGVILGAPWGAVTGLLYLTRVKQLLEVLKSSHDPFAVFLPRSVQAAVHVLLVPFIDGGLSTGQEALSKDDVRAVVLEQQPHDPAT